MRHKYASFIVFIILKFEYEIEARYLLFYFAVVTPANIVQVLVLNEAFNEALSKLSLTTWEVPLAQSDGHTRRLIFILLDNILWHLDIKIGVEDLNR